MAVSVPDLGYKATIGESISRASRLYGEKDFVVLPDRRITFAEADAASKAVAKKMMAAGIGKGTRVGLLYTYSIEWVVAWLAASRSVPSRCPSRPSRPWRAEDRVAPRRRIRALPRADDDG